MNDAHPNTTVRCKYRVSLTVLAGRTPHTQLSQGLKAGLASGVIYGLLVGSSHFSFQAACSRDQINGIAQKILVENLQNVTAKQIYSTQLVVIPIYWGLGALILGVVFGIAFSFLYQVLPGSNSPRKGLAFSLVVFVLGFLLGLPGYGIACSPEMLSLLPLILSLPISLVFGYVLGVFYDNFGRFATEHRKESESSKKLRT